MFHHKEQLFMELEKSPPFKLKLDPDLTLQFKSMVVKTTLSMRETFSVVPVVIAFIEAPC